MRSSLTAFGTGPCHLLSTLCLIFSGLCATTAASDEPSHAAHNLQQLSQLIDQHIAAEWEAQQVVPADQCSDAEFARRVYLDVAGRIPKVSEIRRFLSDEDSSSKRNRLVVELLGTPAAKSHLATNLRRVWMPQVDQNPDLYHLGVAFEAWAAERLRNGVNYDQLVTELMTVPLTDRVETGRITEVAQRHAGAIAFYQINDFKVENLAGASARSLLGLRLECAQCHKHPFDEWTQDQFWQTAAFFTSVRHLSAAQSQSDQAHGRVRIPETDRYVNASLLNEVATLEDARKGSAESTAVSEPRVIFADWATDSENPYFAKHLCNRIWALYMGRGLVHPVDDFRPDNPPSHPELLDLLARAFIESNYDVPFLIEAIIHSEAYQRSSEVSHPSQENPLHYARAVERTLSAEQLWSSLTTATGFRDRIPAAHREIAGLDPSSDRGSFIVAFLGAPDPESPQMSMTHALKLMQGDFMTRMSSPHQGPVVAAISSAPFLTTEEKVEAVFLSALSRPPSPSERERALSLIEREGPPGRQPERIGNLLWSLLNSSEFLLNH